MEFMVFISYVFFAFLLFLFLNLMIKKFHLTKLEYILFTNIFLVFLAGIASCLHYNLFCDDIFIIVVFEFLIRMLYTTYLLDKDFFARDEKILPLYLGNVVTAYLLNQFIIRQVDMVFLNPEQLKFLLWVFIILFLYHFFGKKENISIIKCSSFIKYDIKSKKSYIVLQYSKMKQRYGKDIQIKGDLRFLIYALMIYENYRRPSFFRRLDYLRYQYDHIPRKQGIMQVNTKKIIIKKCIKENIPFISVMGTGNKMHPELLEVTDIRKTEYDPIAKIIRKMVKDEKINKKVPVVFSKEKPLVKGRIGSNSFVPATAGLLATSYVINKLLEEKHE